MSEQQPTAEQAPPGDLIRWTVQILLPESVDRELQRRTDKTPGASWPVWGGHVTLLPLFTVDTDEDTLQQAVGRATAGFGPIEINLDEIMVDQDITRPDYHAVFLCLCDEAEESLQQLRVLRNELDSATRSFRTDVRPALNADAFLPHVTLALGLSEAEAEMVARRLRADGLAVRFTLKEIMLLGFDTSGSAEPSRAYSFPLSARKEAAPSTEPTEQPSALS